MSDIAPEKTRLSTRTLFLILGLTPLLGVSIHFGSSVVYGFLFLVAFLLTGVLNHVLRQSLNAKILFLITLGTLAAVTTLFDFLLEQYLPQTRKELGIYLNLLAINPLIFWFVSDRNPSEDMASALTEQGLTGLRFWGLVALTGLVREVLGHGSLTFFSGTDPLPIPPLNWAPLHVAVTTAGGFFLLAVGVVLVRVFRPQVKKRSWASQVEEEPINRPSSTRTSALPSETEAREPSEVITKVTLKEALEGAEIPVNREPESPPTPVKPTPEPAPESKISPSPPETQPTESLSDKEEPASGPQSWGESLEGVFHRFVSDKSAERKRILVIGSGSGEFVYYLAMLGLEVQKTNKSFQFRVRGVDEFSARIEGALEGIYRENQLDFIPVDLKQTYLLRSREGDRHVVRVSNDPRLHIEFEVANFLKGRVFFHKPCDMIVVNQGLDYLSDEKQVQFMEQIFNNLNPEGTLVLRVAVQREFIPEGLKRTGDQVFRKK